MLLQALDAEQFLAHGCSIGPRTSGSTPERELNNWMHGRLSGRRGHGRPRDQPAEKKMGKMALVEAAGRCGPARLSRLLGSPHRCRYGPGQDRGCRACRHRFLLGLFQFPVAALLLFSCHGVLLLLDVGPLLRAKGAQPFDKKRLASASGKDGDLQDAGVNQREAEGFAHSVTTAYGGMRLHFKAHSSLEPPSTLCPSLGPELRGLPPGWGGCTGLAASLGCTIRRPE
ncbi:hypothetical protein D9M69_564060 [compost metagenome]